MLLKVITPEGSHLELEVSSVSLPGKMGEFCILEGHQPILSSLHPGLVRIETQKGQQTLGVSDGLVEMNGDEILLLTSKVADKSELNLGDSQKKLDQAEKNLYQEGSFNEDSKRYEKEVLEARMEIALLSE